MSRVNKELRERILAELAHCRKTDKEIASALGYSSEVGVRSCLHGMARAGLVKGRIEQRRAAGSSYKPVMWGLA